MEFPGILGIGLFRLRTFMRDVPVAALGPLLGFIAADMSIDIMRNHYGSVLFDLALAPLVALVVFSTAQRDNAGMSGLLLFVLGCVSAFGAFALLTRGLTVGSGGIVVMGLRHLTVGAYAWAAIASEPPERIKSRLAYVRV